MRKCSQPERLHPVQVINNGQPMKSETTVTVVVDVLEPEGVRATVSNLVAATTLLCHLIVGAKYRPNTTHDDAETQKP